MAGHNKWTQIKHKKAATDAKKSKIFGKMSRLITLESKRCGGDMSSPGLRAAVDRARAMNMPNDNIDRAIKKGMGADAGNMEEVLYEAYGPGGCGLLIEGLTDSKNRTAQEIRHILSEHGTTLASPGSASWAFKKEGAGWSPSSPAPISAEDGNRLETLLEALDEHDDVQEVYTNAQW